jgi:putative N6-adenine-specific DNA methylase
MSLQVYTITSPDLESITRLELHEIGIKVFSSNSAVSAGDSQEEQGGVSFDGTLEDIYRANLCLRTTSRVLVRLGEFGAKGFDEYKKKVIRLPWEKYLKPGTFFQVKVTCRKSRLYHSAAVARETAAVLQDTLRIIPSQIGQSAGQLILVRILHDHCTISIDSSGELLHRRGYRYQTAKAPLRETLAAGLLIASGWDKISPLIDPFCGSGTIPIEAAMISRGIPPGKNRLFAFMDWPGYDPSFYESIKAEASRMEKGECASIFAYDRDAGAISGANANAQRAGVEGNLQVVRQSISELIPPSGIGWIVTNPPYGVRVKGGHDLRDLYSRFGDVLRNQFKGWSVAILSGDPILTGHTRLKFDPPIHFSNGGLPVDFLVTRI